MSQPNILLLIFDACRSEELRTHGRTFSNLAEKNVLFTNAFAPSHWSLPAHASILTGEYPSEHGLCTHDSSLSQESIVTKLSLEGYFTAGVSANRIFSSNYGFDAEFDRFEYTMSRSWLNQRTAGIDISKAVEDAAQQGLSGVQKYRYVVEAALTHNNTLSSLYNLCDSGLFTLLNRLPLLDTLHPWFNPSAASSLKC